MLKQFSQTFSGRTQKFQQLTAVLVIFVVAGIGIYLLTFSHAATPYASITADRGTLAGGAVAQTCSGTSGSNCVVFNGTGGGGGGGGGGSGSNPACTDPTRYTSTTAAASAVAAAPAGSVICMAAGSYGSITLTGSHSSNVTFEPDPALDPNGSARAMFGSISVTGSYITVHNFYSTGGFNFLAPATHDIADHNDVTNGVGGYGMDISCNTAAQPCSFITMSGNRVHNLAGTDGSGSGSSCNYGSDGDGLRLDGWSNVTITGNEETGVEQVNGGACEGHTDCLQSYNAGASTQGFDFEHNYIHDNQCEGPPFLKDGNVTSNVTIKNNLDVRSTNRGLSDTALFIVGNTSGAIIRNNAYLTSGSSLQGSGSAIVDHNVFSQFNISGYTLTENNNIFTDGNQWSFTPGSSDLPQGPYGTKYTPAYMCSSVPCGNGTVAGDDYRLASNPNGIGIDWSPVNQVYGPIK